MSCVEAEHAILPAVVSRILSIEESQGHGPMTLEVVLAGESGNCRVAGVFGPSVVASTCAAQRAVMLKGIS